MALPWSTYPRRRSKILCAALAVFATPALADLPSGQDITLHELFLEPQDSGEMWFRLRYLAPAIARETGSLQYADVELDFLHLCETDAITKRDEAGAGADVIGISIRDQPVELGEKNHNVTQFFEAFRVDGTSRVRK